VVLDGNWAQAKALFGAQCVADTSARLVVMPDVLRSMAIFAAKRRRRLSTLEAVALALAVLEHDATVRERLLVPFRD